MNYEGEEGEGMEWVREMIRQGSRYHMILIYRIFLIGIKTELKFVCVSGNVIICPPSARFSGKINVNPKRKLFFIGIMNEKDEITLSTKWIGSSQHG